MNLVTGKVRFSYANVFEPKAVNGETPKYTVTLLIPKSDNITYQNIMTEINKTLQENLASTFKGIMPANPQLPIYDGDGLRPGGDTFGPECKGCWVISAKSNMAPEVVDANCNPIISKNDFYSGCYGRASIRFYAYNQNGNKGIGCGLGNVQKLEDGQPLDGRTTAAEDFGTPVVTSPVPPMGATISQPQYQMPAQQPTMQPAIQGSQVDPITGQPLMPQQNIMQPAVNNIYGVN